MIDKEKIRRAVRMIIEAIGEDPDSPGLRDTPSRVADMYEEIFGGYTANNDLVTFGYSADMVLFRNIRFYSMCEHHILPFFGYIDIAYIPNKKSEPQVIGASKIIRIVEKYARRLQVQEKLTNQIADEIYQTTPNPEGVLVISRAYHMCMIMRGVKNASEMIVIAKRGVFKKNEELTNQALNLLLPRGEFRW